MRAWTWWLGLLIAGCGGQLNSGGRVSGTGGAASGGGSSPTLGGAAGSGGRAVFYDAGEDPGFDAGDGACTGVYAALDSPPVNLIFIADTWGSPMVVAFTSFFNGVTSPDLKASLTLFPAPCDLDLDAGGGCVCSAAEYNPATAMANAAVPLTQIVGHTAAFADLLLAMQPDGGKPTIAALEGSYTYATSVQAASPPGAVTYVVLITDGAPGFEGSTSDGGVAKVPGCSGNDLTSIAALVQSYAIQGIQTYVFGVGTIANLDQVAIAGGTTLVTLPIDPGARTEQLLAALNALPKPEFSCTRPIPPVSEDLSKMYVFFTNSSSSDRHLLYNNPDCSRADGSGWYNWGDTIVLCPPTCDALRQDPSTSLVAQFGCPLMGGGFI